jgi:hypothetical protein
VRLSPVRVTGTGTSRPWCHVPVTAAVALPGTGQQTGQRRRKRTVRHPGTAGREPGAALLADRSPEGVFWDWPGDTKVVMARKPGS